MQARQRLRLLDDLALRWAQRSVHRVHASLIAADGNVQPLVDTPDSYASRLRGMRFWLPLLACFAALLVSGLHWQSHLAPVPRPAARQSLQQVDPVIAAVVRRLQGQRLFCGDLRARTPRLASCRLGAATAPTTFRSFRTHRGVVHQLPLLERAARAAYGRSRSVAYLVSGPRWVITGEWSPTGNYGADATADATVAQLVSKTLNGCLELLPREAGSCSF